MFIANSNAASQSLFVLKDWLTFSASGISLLCSITALLRTEINKRRDSLIEEIRIEINRIEGLADEVASEVEAILLFKLHNGASDHRECLRQTGAKFKKMEQRIPHLQALLPSHRVEIYEAYTSWKAALTSDPYPVQDSSYAIASHDPRFVVVATAQSTLVGRLCSLKRDCLNRKIRV